VSFLMGLRDVRITWVLPNQSIVAARSYESSRRTGPERRKKACETKPTVFHVSRNGIKP
jgi:hypothetical protein